jgi:hypothetical protein
MSDSRKVLMPPLFVAHDRTLTALGDAKGIARLRDAALLELELIPTIHPMTRKPVSSGKGKLKLPGHAEWLPVELPKVERKLTDFTQWSHRNRHLKQVKQQHNQRHQYSQNHHLIFVLKWWVGYRTVGKQKHRQTNRLLPVVASILYPQVTSKA